MEIFLWPKVMDGAKNKGFRAFRDGMVFLLYEVLSRTDKPSFKHYQILNVRLGKGAGQILERTWIF